MKETNGMWKRKDIWKFIADNVNTKKILYMKVTADEHVHDCKALSELI
jgi:hypothetical protein